MVKHRKLRTPINMIRRRGRAEQPKVDLVVTEIRSDGVIPIQPGPPPPNTLGPLVIVWTYCVPWAKMQAFNQWLAGNEPSIANTCSTAMPGVNYRGTYFAMDANEVHYKTIWSYDSIDDIDQWTNALRATTQDFYRNMRTLRSYWAHDCCPMEHRYQPAALFADLDGIATAAAAAGQPFLALTLDAAAQP